MPSAKISFLNKFGRRWRRFRGLLRLVLTHESKLLPKRIRFRLLLPLFSLSLILCLVLLAYNHRTPSVPSATGEKILSYPFASNVIVSEVNNFIFCPIPKAANSNWKYLIRKFEGLQDYKDLTKAHNHNVSGLRYLTDYSPYEVEQILEDPKYFKFIFVRDPFRRLVSCYMDKFQNHDPHYVETEYRSFLAQLYNWHYAWTIDIHNSIRPSFEMFVDEIIKHKPSTMNAHWMPQTVHCGIGLIKYDFIGHMENLQQDTSYILRKLGRENETFPSQQDIGFPPSGASQKIADTLYTTDLRLKVGALYDMDFRLLGYHKTKQN